MKNIIKIALIITLSVLSSIHLTPVHSKESISRIEEQMRIFSDIFVLVTENYVEEVDVEALMRGAYKGMLGELDAYSSFLEPEATELLRSDTEGEFGGLGIRITSENNYITVVTPLPDTPAFRLGILPGDRIVRIEGESSVGLSLREAVSKLRGPKGTEVTISISREGEKDLIEYTITRDIIVPQKVFSNILEGNIAHLRLVEFSEDAPEALLEELKGYEEEGIEGIILDLRNNPGGLLSSAVRVANFFLDRGELIVYTQGRRPDQNRKYHGPQKAWNTEIPLVVLVNRGSASGSEIVAGAIKDNERGVILGENTFGKASVQSVIDLEGGSSLRLTTAKYYTPSGVSIHDKGIEPDIKVILSPEVQLQIHRQQEEILNLPEEEARQREEEKITDTQLSRAHDLLRARRLFMRNIGSGNEK